MEYSILQRPHTSGCSLLRRRFHSDLRIFLLFGCLDVCIVQIECGCWVGYKSRRQCVSKLEQKTCVTFQRLEHLLTLLWTAFVRERNCASYLLCVQSWFLAHFL